MDLNEPAMHSITGKLVANKLTKCDNYLFYVTYQASHSIKGLFKLAAMNSKFTKLKLKNAYNDLMTPG